MSQPVPFAIGLMGGSWGFAIPSPGPAFAPAPAPAPLLQPLLLLLLHQSLLEVLVWRKGKWMRHAW